MAKAEQRACSRKFTVASAGLWRPKRGNRLPFDTDGRDKRAT